METQNKTLVDEQASRPTKSQARLDFSRRLRDLRVPRGFRTARSLAKALDIDENRYTRYERAEVEPDLALIRRICQVLGVTPTELLGQADAADSSSAGSPEHHDTTEKLAMPSSAARPSLAASRDEQPVAAGHGQRSIGVDYAAWKLAVAVAEARLGSGLPADNASDTAASLRQLAIASPLYRRLRELPFETIAEIVADRTITAASSRQSDQVAAAIDALVGALHDFSVARSG